MSGAGPIDKIPGVRRMWDADGKLIAGEEDAETASRARAERLSAARERLAQAEQQSPGSVSRYHARQAKLSAAARRERRRFELLVLGASVDGIENDPDVDPAVRRAALLRNSWRHKHEGTPETHEAASKVHQGPLATLCNNGSIDIDQLAAAVEIAQVAEWLTEDVRVESPKFEFRRDDSVFFLDRNIEGITRVRLHVAYDEWRRRIPAPRAAVLDMIIGEPIGFTVAARKYRMHNRRAKRMLISALNLWPDCVDRATAQITNEIYEDAQAGADQ